MNHPPTQDADDHAHIVYYNSHEDLCFLWSGDASSNVEVLNGRYGSPVRGAFAPPYMVSVKGFPRVCREWVREHRNEIESWRT